MNENGKEICPLKENENAIYVYASFLYLDHNHDAYKTEHTEYENKKIKKICLQTNSVMQLGFPNSIWEQLG